MSASAPSSSAPARRRFGRPTKDDGPRATFGQLLPYIFEHKGTMAVVIVLSVLGAAASLAQPLLVSQVIGIVQKGETLGGLVWALVALVIVSGLISGYQHYLLQRTGESVVLSSRKRLVARMLNLPISEFDARRTGDLVSRVGSDTTLLRAVLTQGLVEAVGGALTFIGALIAMLIIDPVLLGLTVLVIAVSIVVVVLLSGRIRVASTKAQQRVGDLAASVERAITSVRTIRASGATEREIDGVETDATAAYRMGVKVAKISALVVPVAGIAMQVSFLVVLGVGGYRVASGAITVANLVAFILFLFMMILPLGQALGAFTSVNSALGALGRIQEIVDLPSEDANDLPVDQRAVIVGPANAAVNPGAPAIAFTDVRFSYPDAVVAARAARAAEAESVLEGDTALENASDMRSAADDSAAAGALPLPEALIETVAISLPRGASVSGLTASDAIAEAGVLHGVSFAAQRGKRTALVGPSGAGKSTILALIERFYDPDSGSISMGGLDIRTVDRTKLRAQIGYVEQDAPALAGSLRDNLTLASPHATEQQCIDVLHAVNLTEVLERTALGLDAPVGEGGVMLSGGERQRLAIARALLAAPPILLLDESTSSLDGRNEQLMREAIDAVAENRTMIVIAHRLSTVVDSDQIVVIDQGRVIGTGTHSELVETTPLYRDLAKHQLLV
ncbi:ABC transporter ATP-binding protein [Planctomonas sp. JC2975]|uniref:ABC transporter ATP-binding protein n=1 Tax=Planctomonas sp. JC2975 TaxID=2729626 RepID=UPI0014746602|nr:ABC transporter ATP-binding protein [Planctomonas sp. JC2975]NNC12995.1 ABC transporter ATP-binding protein [Planctomonas sp. JC2975]